MAKVSMRAAIKLDIYDEAYYVFQLANLALDVNNHISCVVV